MTRLPKLGSDTGNWGAILNDFLLASHNSNGTLKGSAISAAGGDLTAHKGVANGYASLDSNGLVPSSQLPTVVGVGEYLGVYSTDAIDNNSFGQVTFDDITATRGSTSLAWNNSNPTSVQVLQSGVYAVTATVNWNDNGASGLLYVEIFTECQFIIDDQRGGVGDSSTSTSQCISGTFYLQTGQDISLYVNQSTDSSLSSPYITMLITRCT